MELIDKSALVAEIERRLNHQVYLSVEREIREQLLSGLLLFIDNLEVKEVDSMIHTIVAECCDWLAINTNLSHDEIEGCRNLMLTVKDEQFKARKGE